MVWDAASDPLQLERAQELRRIGVEVTLGGSGLELLDGVRTIVKSPGVPPEIPVVCRGRQARADDRRRVDDRLVLGPGAGRRGHRHEREVDGRLAPGLGARQGTASSRSSAETPSSGLRSASSRWAAVPVRSSPRYPATRPSTARRLVGRWRHLHQPDPRTPQPPRHDGGLRGGEARALRPGGRSRSRSPRSTSTTISVGSWPGRSRTWEAAALRYGRGRRCGVQDRSSPAGASRSRRSRVESPSGQLTLSTRLPGLHNARNVVSVLALADGLGLAARSPPSPPSESALPGAGEIRGRSSRAGRSTSSSTSPMAPTASPPCSPPRVEIVAPRGGRLIAVRRDRRPERPDDRARGRILSRASAATT